MSFSIAFFCFFCYIIFASNIKGITVDSGSVPGSRADVAHKKIPLLWVATSLDYRSHGHESVYRDLL